MMQMVWGLTAIAVVTLCGGGAVLLLRMGKRAAVAVRSAQQPNALPWVFDDVPEPQRTAIHRAFLDARRGETETHLRAAAASLREARPDLRRYESLRIVLGAWAVFEPGPPA